MRNKKNNRESKKWLQAFTWNPSQLCWPGCHLWSNQLLVWTSTRTIHIAEKNHILKLIWQRCGVFILILSIYIYRSEQDIYSHMTFPFPFPSPLDAVRIVSGYSPCGSIGDTTTITLLFIDTIIVDALPMYTVFILFCKLLPFIVILSPPLKKHI